MTEDRQPEEAARKLFAGACDFVWGSTTAENLPPEKLNEVAFVGRSNAGKSSLVNALTGRKSLARVSQTPGATRQINFFNLADRLMLVDLPGYGFAKRSKTESEAWQEMIFSYLRRRSRLRRVLLLIDARRGVMDSDEMVMNAAGPDRRVLWPGADQGRRTQAHPAGQPRWKRRAPPPPSTPPPCRRCS
jgi:GTP-binding protein